MNSDQPDAAMTPQASRAISNSGLWSVLSRAYLPRSGGAALWGLGGTETRTAAGSSAGGRSVYRVVSCPVPP